MKYMLDMFLYPSGAGLYVGHPEGYRMYYWMGFRRLWKKIEILEYENLIDNKKRDFETFKIPFLIQANSQADVQTNGFA